MPRGKDLSEAEIEQENRAFLEGITTKTIARILNRSHSTIINLVHRGFQKGVKRCGRPRKTSAHDQRRVIRAASNKVTSTNRIRRDLQLNVSASTVLRMIRRDPNFVWKKKLRRAELTARHVAVRLAWCGARNLWVEQWRRIVWSDEKKFNLDGPDGLSYYWHDKRKRDLYFQSRQRGGGSVMVWAAFGYNGRTPIRWVTRS